MPIDNERNAFEGMSRGNGRNLPITVPLTRAYSSHIANPYDWEQVLRVLGKNARLIAVLVFLTTLAVGGYAYHLKDSYTPTARLQIDPPGTAALSPRDAETIVENDQEYLETQSQILQSDELATQVIRSLRLDENPELVGRSNLARFANPARPANNGGAATNLRREWNETSLEDQFRAAERTPLETIALRVFRGRLAVGVVRGSRLVEVSFTSNDPRLAQKITNNLIAQFIDQNFKTRYITTTQASDWLLGQLSDLRHKVEDSNQAVVNYQRHYGLLEEDDKDGPTSQLASGLSHQLAEAQADRIQAESFVRMIDTGHEESLPQLRQSQVYENVSSRYAEASARLAQAGAIYGEQNNNYKKIQNEVNELAAQRDSEKQRIVGQVHTVFAAAKEREELMNASMARLKVQMGDVNERMVQYHVLKDEARANSDLYNTLLARLKEAGLYAGLKSSNIRVVDPASVLDRPTAPHRPLMVAAGLMFGIIFAVIAAFVREGMNNTIRTPDDITDWTGLPSVAMVPLISPEPERDPRLTGGSLISAFRNGRQAHSVEVPRLLPPRKHTWEAEAFRELRTSLLYSNGETSPQTILVTSAAGGEGKSTVAVNLAVALSQQGKTCLMDADLRRPTISRIFNCSSNTAWTNAVIGRASIDQSLVTTEIPNLCVMPAGRTPTDPAELIASKQIRDLLANLKPRFDFVVIDSPPTIPFSDARGLALMVDGVLLVGRYGLTTRRALTRCADSLREIGAPVIGVVVNGMDFGSSDYRYYNFGHSSVRLQRYYPEDLPAAASEAQTAATAKAKGAGA